MTTTDLTTAPVPSTTTARLRPGPRVRLLAAALALQPVLIGINALFHPDVDLDGASLLAGAAESSTGWYVVHLVAALGAILGVPAAFALRRLVSTRRRTIGDTALTSAVVAGPLLAVAFVAEAAVFHLLADTSIPHDAALELADAYTSTPLFFAVPLALMASALATAMFAVALLRDRVVPRWQPWAYLGGTVLSAIAVPGTAMGPIAFGIVAVAATGLARQLTRTRDALLAS